MLPFMIMSYILRKQIETDRDRVMGEGEKAFYRSFEKSLGDIGRSPLFLLVAVIVMLIAASSRL